MNHLTQHTTDAVKTTCCYCGVGCGIIAKKVKQGKIEIEGDASHPANKGMLCSKGMNLHYTAMDTSDRLLYPQMRYAKHLPKERVTWEAAMQRTAAVFQSIIKKYGPDSVAFYVSGQCLTEEYYIVNKLVKGFIGTNNIDTNSRLCMSSAVAAYKMSLGEDAVPVCYNDIELADCIFVTGANPAWCHPIIWRRVEAAKAANPHLKIIVADPRKTQTCSIADVHLQIQPGTDIVLNHAIGRYLIEHDWIDIDFLLLHTQGFDEYRTKVFEKTLEEAATICDVSVEAIATTAQIIGKAKAFLSMWTMGLNQSVIGVNKNLSLINLHLITGQIGKPGSGPFSLTGQPNAMGGREVGGLANMLPAHRNLANADDRAWMQHFWKGTTISPQPGLTATEMFKELETGTLKAIWIICTNPLISLPDVRQAENALKKAKFVVVQDVKQGIETLPYADVVLPAATWLEKQGTMTNSERRITMVNQLINPPGEALPDATILCKFAQAMGYRGFDFKDAAAIYKEHCLSTAHTNIDITGLNYQILQQKRSVQWPYPKGSNNNGTARLFTDHQFFTPHQKAIIHAVNDDNLSENTNPQHPLILTTGRIRDQWHTMTKTGKVNKLKQHIANAFVEINPLDALARGISNNDLVEVFNARGNARVKAVITNDIKQGVVFMPMHWGKILQQDLNRANNLTNCLVDAISKEPDFKFSAVDIKKYQPAARKIIVIGAGAGACGFVKSYRNINTQDVIDVFSKEDYPFYNRVLLPDYINGSQPWEHLIKITDAEEQQLNFTLHRGVSIDEINRTHRYVIDSKGKKHEYDILIMATGSRAAMLRDVPKLNGIFTMRSRVDADKFLQHIQADNGKVVIVGGGLLGIELAASLREMQIDITIIQRISRLMDRQLDPLGSQLLHEELDDKGIEILYNDEIERFFGVDASVTGIQLKSGRKIDCQAIVVAVGTVANIELAKDAGLACKRGVIVNEYLQTSDEHIFAIGEIAEFKGFLYGITAAAEQQAAIVAEYLNGNIAQYYSGSLLMNILKMHGTSLCSLGMVECPAENGYEEVVFIDKAKRYYKKCIIHNDKLVGAILIGDKSEFLEFKNLIENKIELSEKRLQLLRSGKTTEPVLGKLVCSCNNVGEGNLINKINEGCKDHLQLCQITGAGMGCGSCRPEVKNILENQLQSALATVPA